MYVKKFSLISTKKFQGIYTSSLRDLELDEFLDPPITKFR